MANYYNPKETTTNFLNSIDSKISVPVIKFCLLSVLGGVFIAFGGLLSVQVAGGMFGVGEVNPGLIKFIAGALFPIGLIIVSISGADLFTSDCAAFTLGRLERRVSSVSLIKYLALSYLFNFVGTQIIAFLFTYQTGLLQSEPWLSYLHKYAAMKVDQDFYTVFIKGVGANWLVCLGMFLGYAAKDILGKCIGIWIPVMLFVTLGYEHSIANMYFIPTAIYTGADISWADFIIQNLVPSSLGNLIGGAVLVGSIYWYLYLKEN